MNVRTVSEDTRLLWCAVIVLQENALVLRLWWEKWEKKKLTSVFCADVVYDKCTSGEHFWCCGEEWWPCALRHGIQSSTEAILACHPARSTEWLDWVAKSCEWWCMRTGLIPKGRIATHSWIWTCDGNAQPKRKSQILLTCYRLWLVLAECNRHRLKSGRVRLFFLSKC